MALLLRSTAAFRSALHSSLHPRQAAHIAGWATSPPQTIYSMGTDAFSRRSHANPVQTIYKPHQYFSTLQEGDANTSAEEDDEPTTSANKSNGKSRKQRRSNTKELNFQRIDKILAHRGIGTRSRTFELAKSKRVTYASREDAPHHERTRIRGPKEKIPFESAIFLDGKLLPGPPPLLLLYNKPKFVLSVMKDDKKYEDQQRKHLGHVLEPRYVKAGMHPVGRLDYDTTGLILFSLDGKLTQALLHPRRGVKKEYVATVQGVADEDQLAKKLSEGVETTEGVHKANLISVTPSDGPAEDSELDEIMALENQEENVDEKMLDDFTGPYSDVRVVVSEGKYRMVRRMLANCGHPVVELRRLRHGNVDLGDLKEGEFRQATAEETEWAKSLMK